MWEESKLDRVEEVCQRRGASVFERSLQLGADVLCTGGFAWLNLQLSFPLGEKNLTSLSRSGKKNPVFSHAARC